MLKREEKEGAKPNNISTTKTLLQSHLKTPWVFRPTLSCKLSLKDSYLLFSLLPLPSKGYPTQQGILHKMRVEKAAGVKAPPIQTRLWPEEALRTPCVPHHCRVNSGCLFPLCFPLGKEVRDWAVQVISKSCSSLQTTAFRTGNAEGWERASLLKNSSSPFLQWLIPLIWVPRPYLQALTCNRSSEFDLFEALTLLSCRF